MAGTTPAKKAAPRKATAGASRRRAQTAASQLLPGVTAPEPEGLPAAKPFTGLNLDTLEKKTVLPHVTDAMFEFILEGQVYEMIDPRDVDWKGVLDGLTNPLLFMRLAMPDPQAADRFIATPLPGWKLSALFDNWQAHYKVEGFTDLNLLLSGRIQGAAGSDGE